MRTGMEFVMVLVAVRMRMGMECVIQLLGMVLVAGRGHVRMRTGMEFVMVLVAGREMFCFIAIRLLLCSTIMVFVVDGVSGATGRCAARLNVELQATNTELVHAAVPVLHWVTPIAAAMMKKLKLASTSLAP